MVKCPRCGFEGEFKQLKTWRFRFYDVRMLECPNCNSVFNHYYGVSSAGRASSFTIRIRPKGSSSGGSCRC